MLSGCNKQQSVSDRLLNEVEKAIAINPDSASNLLKSISSPEKLDDKAFARWCMLSGKITDEIFNSILPTYQLERAYDWYSSHGSPDEQVQILIYLGRSFFADGDYDKTEGVDENNKELTFLIEGLSEEKEIPSFEKDDEIILYTFKVKPNTHEEYNIITNFYINNLDQSELTNNSIDFTYFVKQTNC